MTEYARPLWLGGGVSYEALKHVYIALLTEAHSDSCTNPAVCVELMNIANAAAAEITKRPKPSCDLI